MTSFEPLLANVYMNRFLKYWRIIGHMIFKKDGSWYTGACASKTNIGRLRRSVRNILRPGEKGARPKVRDQLNALLRGWCTCFCYGTTMITYRYFPFSIVRSWCMIAASGDIISETGTWERQRMREQMTDMVLENNMCVLATASGNRPHCSLMAYVADEKGEKLYMATPGSSRKFENLSENLFVSLLIDTRGKHPREKTKALTVSGICEPVREPEEKSAALARLRSIHPQLATIVNDPAVEILCVKAESFLLLDGISEAHFVEVDESNG